LAVITSGGLEARGLPRVGCRTPPPDPSRRESKPRLEIWDEHLLAGGGEIPLSPAEAREALRRGSVKVTADVRAKVFDVYCSRCRRPFTDVVGTACIVEPEILNGGPIATRAKRRKADESEDQIIDLDADW
jgi:hypothetical protein